MNWFRQKFLWSRTRDYISTYHPLTIGITGGLETAITREAIALALKQKFYPRTTHENLADPEDVALSVLGLHNIGQRTSWFHLLNASKAKEFSEEEPNALVIDYPTPKPNQIDILSKKIPFNIGIITSSPSTHLDLFNQRALVTHELLSLTANLPPDGFAIINRDYPLLWPLPEKTQAKIITYGQHPESSIRLTHTNFLGPNRGFRLTVASNNQTLDLHLPHLISHSQTHAVLPALAITQALKLDFEKTVNSLIKLKPTNQDLQLKSGRDNSTLLDRASRAHPETVVADLTTLKNISTDRKIAVLGDLSGLGPQKSYWYNVIIHRASKCADLIILVGEDISQISTPNPQADIHKFKNTFDATNWLTDFVQSKDLILITGATRLNLSKLVNSLSPDLPRDHQSNENNSH